MNGVEVLSQTTIYEVTQLQWVTPLCVTIGVLIGALVVIFGWRKAKLDAPEFGIILVLGIAGMLIGGFIQIVTTKTTDTVDYIEYKVTIDDSVSMNEFLDKYEILDQEGKIYTIKEKTNDT